MTALRWTRLWSHFYSSLGEFTAAEGPSASTSLPVLRLLLPVGGPRSGGGLRCAQRDLSRVVGTSGKTTATCPTCQMHLAPLLRRRYLVRVITSARRCGRSGNGAELSEQTQMSRCSTPIAAPALARSTHRVAGRAVRQPSRQVVRRVDIHGVGSHPLLDCQCTEEPSAAPAGRLIDELAANPGDDVCLLALRTPDLIPSARRT